MIIKVCFDTPVSLVQCYGARWSEMVSPVHLRILLYFSPNLLHNKTWHPVLNWSVGMPIKSNVQTRMMTFNILWYIDLSQTGKYYIFVIKTSYQGHQ